MATSNHASAEAQYIRMTETPIQKLVLQLGLPTTISMLVTTIYNMADTYFVSDLGTSQSGAVGVVFALMAIIQAFGFMFGHGAGSNIGRLLGAHEAKQAGTYATTSVVGGIISGLLITILGLSMHTPFMYLLGSTDTILPYAKDYSFYILLAAPVMTVSCILNNILRYEGMATFAMAGLVSGGVLNILGDYILINVADMGVAGAGLATACSQFIAMIILAMPFITHKTQSKIDFIALFRKPSAPHASDDNVIASSDVETSKPEILNLRRLGSIIAIGLPSLMRQGLNSISTMLLNASAKPYGDAAIAAMSIVAKIVGFMFCIGLGIGQGFQPVAGFNYGARKYTRVKKAYWFTYLFSTCLLGCVGIIGFVFAEPLVTIFRDDPEVIAIGRVALRFQAASLVCLPMTVSGNMLFQSTGHSVRATFLAATRSGLYFIPTLLVLRSLLGVLGIECSQAVADLLAALTTLPIVLSFLRSLPPDDEE